MTSRKRETQKLFLALLAQAYHVNLEMAHFSGHRPLEKINLFKVQVPNCAAAFTAEMAMVLPAQRIDFPLLAEVGMDLPLLFQVIEEAIDSR